MLPGIDVASFQGAPGRWQPLAGKISWAAVKWTELSSTGPYVDPDAKADWAALGAMGAGRIAYLFGHPSSGVTATVDLFLSVLRPVLAGEDGVVLDLEVSDGLAAGAVSAWARAVCALLERETGRTPLLYTFRSFALAGNCAGLGHLPLWIADPDHPAGKPDVPGPWKSWAIHQYKDAPLDRDVANYPSLAAMRAALGKPAPRPKPAPTEDDMPQLMKPGQGSVTPVSIPAGRTKLVLTPETEATVGVQFLDHGTENYPLVKQPKGGAEVAIPPGVRHAWLHRLDNAAGDVSYAVE